MTTTARPTAAPPVTEAAGSPARRHRGVAVGLFLLLLGVYGLAAGGHTYSSDEEGMFATTRALVTNGDPVIPVSDDNDRVIPIRTGRTGEPVGVSGIGQSLIAVPAYVLGAVVGTNLHGPYHDYVERLFVGWTNSVVTATGAVLLFFLGRRLGATTRGACAVALVYGLGTYAFPHAKTFFSEPLTATTVVAAALAAIAARQDGSLRLVVLAGVCAGAALLARASAALFVPPLGLYVVVTFGLDSRSMREAIRAGIAFTAGMVPPAVVLMLTNWWRWGSPIDLGYSSVPLNFPVTEGLYGLFLSPGKSIFLYAPGVAVGMGAIFVVGRRRWLEVALLLGMGFVNALFFARFVHWHGDHSWGPRYLIMSLPLWLAPAAAVLHRPLWARALAATGIAGGACAVLGAGMYFNQYFHIAERDTGPLEILVDGPNYWRDMHFDPYWSPVAGHARALPEVVRNTADLVVDGAEFSTAFPTTTNGRYGWYFAPPQSDSWLYWIQATDGPRRVYPMAALQVGAVAAGAAILRRTLRVAPLRVQ